MANTSALVNMEITNNATWEDAFRFGDTDDLTWSLTGQKFRMDIKGNVDQAAALLTLTSDAGTIVVDDVTQRVIHMLVPEAIIQAALVPGEYVYDLIMYSTALPVVRVQMMSGKIVVTQGVTGG